MTQAVVFLSSALLAAVAAAGVLRPWGSGRAAALERLTDPLEDERIGLLRALRDLEEERARGELADDAYVELRGETESERSRSCEPSRRGREPESWLWGSRS